MKKTKGGYAWKPLRPADVLPPSPALLVEAMREYRCDEKTARALLDAYQKGCEMYRNDVYQVQVRRDPESRLVHINVRRLDGAAIIRDWRHFQQIKNEILGPECEAVELYPAESRKVDATNKYHLFGYADPEFRFPIGMEKRDVRYDEDHDVPGMRQRAHSLRVEGEST